MKAFGREIKKKKSPQNNSRENLNKARSDEQTRQREMRDDTASIRGERMYLDVFRPSAKL